MFTAFRKMGLAALTVAVLWGCSSVRDAREVQRKLVPFGEDASVPTAVLPDLRGRTLAGLVAFALENRPSVVSARLEVEDARLALRELAADAPIVSKTPWMAPQLSLASGYSAQTTPAAAQDFTWSTRDGEPSVGLSLQLPVWDFGRYGAKARAQAEAVVAAELKLADEGYVVFGEVSAAYFSYLEKNALLDVAQTNEWRYETLCAYAEERERAGEAERLDVLRAQLDLAQARQKTVSARNAVGASGAVLLHALGVEAPRGTYESVLGRFGSGVGTLVRGFAPTTETVSECYGFAYTNKPAMRVKRAQFRAASHAVDYAVADLMPKVSATASLSWTDPLWLWKWGVSASQSLFEGFRKTRQVDRARVALEKAAAAVTQEGQDLSRNLQLAIETRDNAVEALRTASASVERARENYDTVVSRRDVGDVSRIEVSSAAGEYSTALGDRISAFYEGQRAEAALFALLGREPAYREGKEEVSE